MQKDLRSENDNLQGYRKKRSQLTEKLLKKSIDELIKINATINQKTVCEMMDRLASAEDKDNRAIISPSAISKNEVYKNMIFEAKEKVKLVNSHDKTYKLDGDKKLEVFQLKTIIAKKEAKIKELESIIDRANIQRDSNYKTNNISQEVGLNLKEIVQELVRYVKTQGIAFCDKKNNLLDELTHDIIIAANIMENLDA